MKRLSISGCFVSLFVLTVLTGSIFADNIMGQYKGTFFPDSQVKIDATAKVVAEGGGKYRIMINAPTSDPDREGAFLEINGMADGSGNVVNIENQSFGGYTWKGQISDGRLTLGSAYGLHFELNKIESKSPNAGMKPPSGAVILLPFGKENADLSQWTNENWKALENGVMECVPKKGANKTKLEFGDIKHFHIEFKLPLEPEKRGQGRANSGVYISDAYEVQVLDSFGLLHTSGDCGGLYNIARARVNACLPPEVWQTYDITFRAPRFDDNGQVKELPRITVIHNGIKIHDNQEIPKARNREKGPIQLQDHGHPIQFRNVWIIEG